MGCQRSPWCPESVRRRGVLTPAPGWAAQSAPSGRRRLSEQLAHTPTSFRRDPEDPSAVALKEPWQEKVR